MKNDKFTSIFDGITDLEFEGMLQECGFSYRKVAKGQGGLKVNGKIFNSEFFLLEKFWDKMQKNSKNIYKKESIYSYMENSEFQIHERLREAI